MNCKKAIDTMYADHEPPLFAERLFLAAHILFCGRCALALRRYQEARGLLLADCIPASPDFADAVMASIYAEEGLDAEDAEALDIPGGFTTRGWVIAGCATLVSLAAAFFGSDFLDIARRHGSSFLLPIGIITGIIITAYGSLFIGSHLKELSERFHLR